MFLSIINIMFSICDEQSSIEVWFIPEICNLKLDSFKTTFNS